MAMGIQPSGKIYRYILLFFNCMLTFGSHMCFSIPMALQNAFVTTPCSANDTVSHNATCFSSNTNNFTNKTCCKDCLGMSYEQYNQLFAFYFWVTAISVLGAGFLADKCGNKIGIYMFSVVSVLGSSFALGSMPVFHKYTFILMLTGRLVLAAGKGASAIQMRVTSVWFKDKELAMAFGFTYMLEYTGTVLNFLFTESFQERFGIVLTLWGGAALSSLGLFAAVIVCSMDTYGIQKLGKESQVKEQSRKMRITDVKHFPLTYWFLVSTSLFFYSGYLGFVANSSEFLNEKYGYENGDSVHISGAVYYVAIVMSPAFGCLVDRFGYRAVGYLICSVLSVTVFAVLTFSTLTPLILIITLGFAVSLAAASSKPSIPQLVNESTIGTAIGVNYCIDTLVIGIWYLVIGGFLGNKDTENLPKQEKLLKWLHVMIFILSTAVAGVISAVLLVFTDWKKGNGKLNQGRESKKRVAINVANNNEKSPLVPKMLIND